MQRLRQTIYRVAKESAPMTVRQVFYQLVSIGAISKTETEYKTTVVRLLTDMRLKGELPFSWLADNTRWMRKPRTFDSLEDALQLTADTYRRATFMNQSTYCEVWLEKDALAGVIYEETAAYDVPLMVTRGYASISYLHGAAQAIATSGKPAFLYYLGDFDPSGLDIPRNVEVRLRQFAPDAEIHFTRLAVTHDQIGSLQLPTRPTKATDTRARDFAGESVEVDAIPPAVLRKLVRDAIEQHIDRHSLALLRIAEESEREVLQSMVSQVSGAE
jgi:hypothetical protein